MSQEPIKHDNGIHDGTQTAFLPPKIEIPAKSLMMVQKERYEIHKKATKVSEKIDKLYRLDETKRQAMEIVRNEMFMKDSNVVYSFQPEIDKHSQKIADKRDLKFVERVSEWNHLKEEKLKDKKDTKQREIEEDLIKQTIKPTFSNSTYQANSKVKEFVESMDYQKSMYSSKLLYNSANFEKKPDEHTQNLENILNEKKESKVEAVNTEKTMPIETKVTQEKIQVEKPKTESKSQNKNDKTLVKPIRVNKELLKEILRGI